MASSNELQQYIKKKKWNKVITRINVHPVEVNVTIKQRFQCGTEITCLPIHAVCMRRPPLKLVMMMIALNPGSVKMKDSRGRLPIHHACRYGASFEVVNSLLQRYPEGAKAPSELDGWLPIHSACLFGRSPEVVSTLLQVYPESVEKADFAGLTPSDYAADNPSSVKAQFIILLERAALRLDSRKLHTENLVKSIDAVPAVSDSEESNSLQQQDKPMKKRSSTKLCVVCMDKEVCRILLPCGHPCLCDGCSEVDGLIRMGWRCPECRCNVQEVAAFYGRVVND